MTLPGAVTFRYRWIFTFPCKARLIKKKKRKEQNLLISFLVSIINTIIAQIIIALRFLYKEAVSLHLMKVP